MRDLEGVHNDLTISPFRRDSLDLPVRTVQSQTFMERIVIKVNFIHSQLKIWQYFNKKIPSCWKFFSISLGTILGVSIYGFCGFVCTECDCEHGVCNTGSEGDGQCLCQPPYSGPRCDRGKSGFYTLLKPQTTLQSM